MVLATLDKLALNEDMEIFEIKTTQSRDYLQCITLLQKAFDLSVDEIKNIGMKIEGGIEPPDEAHLLAIKENNMIIGCVVFYYLGQVNFGFMELITIKDDYRKRGLGSFLYAEMINFLQKKHPGLKAMVHEVQNWLENLDRRKAFFLHQGAIPLDITFYPLPSVIKDSGLIFMIHPLKFGLKWEFDTISRMFKNISVAI